MWGVRIIFKKNRKFETGEKGEEGKYEKGVYP